MVLPNTDTLGGNAAKCFIRLLTSLSNSAWGNTSVTKPQLQASTALSFLPASKTSLAWEIIYPWLKSHSVELVDLKVHWVHGKDAKILQVYHLATLFVLFINRVRGLHQGWSKVTVNWSVQTLGRECNSTGLCIHFYKTTVASESDWYYTWLPCTDKLYISGIIHWFSVLLCSIRISIWNTAICDQPQTFSRLCLRLKRRVCDF